MADRQDIMALEVSDADLAALFGVTPRHVRGLAQDGKFAKIGRNSYHLGDALRGFLESKKTSDSAAKRLIEERARKLSADADLAELNLAKAKAEVAPIAEFERVQGQLYSLVQANMLNVPSRVSMQIVGSTDEAHIKAVLRDEIISALKQAADAKIDDEDPETDELEEDEE
ncbi:terminase small subunit [Sphingomonas sanguinis]|jgi:phage terminase Nu1 subunit (DNA packaging protein)|uniref:Terminase small subunit n=1 Tax=Sphingomonas sanguinis TaxID=33051 RepID=A0A7Y7QTY3_9SPHN|nr:terminase small subunit [Sphingomonas sanguinis]MBZ6381122.1 terminase small subunit [Sphingomonas sanguinis]NNG51274.1 hypothetical protein [Sphingomonas sanguinis]NNG55224.1 hypothetical protein [Sphingomonas sanguinis]NVP30424.1 terminase small subunit [Sphingomonas sanguinis]